MVERLLDWPQSIFWPFKTLCSTFLFGPRLIPFENLSFLSSVLPLPPFSHDDVFLFLSTRRKKIVKQKNVGGVLWKRLFCLKLPIPGLFFYFRFYYHIKSFNRSLEPGPSVVNSNRSVNCTTITAHGIMFARLENAFKSRHLKSFIRSLEPVSSGVGSGCDNNFNAQKKIVCKTGKLFFRV